MRAIRSAPPPGANGTTRRIGLDGQLCACAAVANARTAASATIARRVIVSSRLGVSLAQIGARPARPKPLYKLGTLAISAASRSPPAFVEAARAGRGRGGPPHPFYNLAPVASAAAPGPPPSFAEAARAGRRRG